MSSVWNAQMEIGGERHYVIKYYAIFDVIMCTIATPISSKWKQNVHTIETKLPVYFFLQTI